MSLALTQNKTAIGVNRQVSFLATGGTSPYVYSVNAGGPGGTINSASGLYTAPGTIPVTGTGVNQIDTITVTDNVGATASAQIIVGQALDLLLDILQTVLGLADDHCFFWDQKIFQPTDNGLYLVLSNPDTRVYSNVSEAAGTPVGQGGPGWDQVSQWCNVNALIDVNIISRDNSALYRKEEVVLALASSYSETQQEGNGLLIGAVTKGIRDLSGIDGADIPYRFQFEFQMQYAFQMTKAGEYYNSFDPPAVTVNP